MSQSSIFPVYIKTQYDGSGGAFDQLTREARNSVDESKRIFDAGYSQIQGLVSKALSVPRNDLGSLNLGVDEYRRAAQEAEALALASREVSNAMQVQTRAAASVSKEDQLVAASARAAATAAETQANEYRALARAAELTQEALNRQKSATDAVVVSTTRGTDAWGIHAQSMRGSRQAMVQTGQQLQDLGISLYSGQNASVVFAQQLPQLAFALTSLEGSANKTQARIGAFATALSSPLGSIALLAGAAGLGFLIEKLFQTGKEADKSSSAMDRLSDRLDLTKNSYESLIDVVNEYNKAQDKSTALTYEAISAAEKQAETNLRLAETQLAKLRTLPQEDTGTSAEDILSARRAQEATFDAMEAKIAGLRKGLVDATKAVAIEEAKRATDPKYKIETDYNVQIVKAREESEEKLTKLAGNQVAYAVEKARLIAEEEALINKKIAALDKLDKAQRKAKESEPKPPKLADVTGAEVARLLGTRATSGTRTPAQNKAAGGAANSYHLTGQAIDIPLTVGGNPLTKEGIRAALAPAGVIIKELLGPGDKNHSDHFHIAFSRKRGAPDQIEKQAEAAKKALDSLIQTGENAGRTIAGINARWNEQPRLVDQVKKDVADLDLLIADLKKKNAGGIFNGEIAAAEDTRALALDASNKILRDMVQANAENAAIDSLRLQGLTVEAEVLSRTLAHKNAGNAVTEREAETIAQIVMDENRRAILLERQNEAQQRSLQIIEDTKSNVQSTVRDLLSGKGFAAIGDFFKRQWDIYLDGLASQITDQLFGEAFQQQKLKILGLDKVDEAGREMALKITQTVNDLERLRNAASGAATALAGVPANDNPLPGRLEDEFDKQFGTLKANSFEQDMRATLKTLFKKVFGERLSNDISEFISKNAAGAGYGQIGGGLAGNKSSTGSAIGGMVGYGLAAGSSAIGKVLGSFAGPIGGILGGVVGSLIGGLFSKAKTGSASVSNGAISLGGNNSEARGSANSSASGIASQLSRIAEQLGGSVGSYDFTIGSRKDEYRVSGSAGANVTSKNPGGLLYKGKDAEEAARVALLNAIQDGAITGIRAGAQRLLQAGKDLEAQVTKALSFQSIFDRLKAYEDPMGAALDKLDREFENLRKIAIEAGEGLVELEKLYGIERANVIKEANEKITSSLRDLYDSLTVGNDARSLSERQALAMARYTPLAGRVASGDSAAYDDFATAARELLDIERQIFGSQSGYFSRLDEITSLTKTRIDAESNVASISSDRPGIFTPTVANDNVPVVNSIDAQTNAIVSIGNTTNALLADLLSKWNGTIGTQVAAGNYF